MRFYFSPWFIMWILLTSKAVYSAETAGIVAKCFNPGGGYVPRKSVVTKLETGEIEILLSAWTPFEGAENQLQLSESILTAHARIVFKPSECVLARDLSRETVNLYSCVLSSEDPRMISLTDSDETRREVAAPFRKIEMHRFDITTARPHRHTRNFKLQIDHQDFMHFAETQCE